MSNIGNITMTATKANVGALVSAGVTVVLYGLARATGIVEIPDASLVNDAVITLVTAAVTYGVTWVSVYFTRNTVKVP